MKKDFPIFQNNPSLVYLDSAATSQKPKMVLDAIQDYYSHYNANVRRGLYSIAEKATRRMEEVRKQVVSFVNAETPGEIIFVRNATEAINLVAYSLSHNIQEGDRIVTTIMEHHANFVPWQQLAKIKRAKFEVINFSENFKFQSAIWRTNPNIKNAKILAISHVSNVLGTINPIKEIIKEVRKQNPNILVLVDAAQSVPHMKVDVQDLDCDFLVFSGHKMMAATGIGVLYGKKEILSQMEPFLFGGEMIKEVTVGQTTFAKPPYRFEAGTPDIAGIISLGAAIEYINETDIENIQKHEKELVKYAMEKINSLGNIEIYGPENTAARGGVISFNLLGIHPHDVSQILGKEGICVRAGHHCAMPLHQRLNIVASVRASFYLYNDKADIDALIKGLQKVQKMFHSSV